MEWCEINKITSIKGINLNRGPVEQDHLNFVWTPANFKTVIHLDIEILNISRAKSVSRPQEFLLGY